MLGIGAEVRVLGIGVRMGQMISHMPGGLEGSSVGLERAVGCYGFTVLGIEGLRSVVRGSVHVRSQKLRSPVWLGRGIGCTGLEELTRKEAWTECTLRVSG